MPRNYKRKTTRGEGGTWTKETMEKAVEALKSGGLSVKEVAAHFKVPMTTLQLKATGWKGRKVTLGSTGGGGRSKTLPLDEEQKLTEMLKTMSKWGFGLSKLEVLNVVQEFVRLNKIPNGFKDDRPGNDWFRSFCFRNNLSLKKPEIVEGSRSRQSNDPFIVYDFFDQLSSVIIELNLQDKPQNLHNCDESGFKSDPTSTKVVTTKGVQAKRVTGGNARKTTTVLACVNAAGEKLPPLILHKGKKLWDNMIGESAYPGTTYAVSENGWMTEKVFTKWFKSSFVPSIKEKPCLLLYDGHLSHISIELIQAAIESEVTILKLPPHTSHILQPLDVSVFKGVKSRWDSLLAEWARHNYGKILPKSAFSNILGKTWTSIQPEVIRKGFEKTGIFDPTSIFPVNRLKIDEKNFDPNKLNRYKIVHPIVVQTPAPESEVEVETTQTSSIQISIGPSIQSQINSEINLTISPSKNFESILLKTVSPAMNEPSKKRKRVDNAEIITKESYLQKLQEDQDTKLKEKQEKASAKVIRKERVNLQKLSKPIKKKGVKSDVVKSKIPTKVKSKAKLNNKNDFPKKKNEKRCLF